MGLVETVGFIASHPLSRGRRASNLARFVTWQLRSRLSPDATPVPWVNGSAIWARRGLTGMTGNLYVGLHEFADMGFVLHALRRSDLFVDVGANVGSYTVLAGAAVGARCVAFEPVGETFAWLERNVALNQMGDRVEARRVALGSAPGTLELTACEGAMNHVVAAGEPAPARTERVPVETLDAALGGREPALLKIDVEGYESEVLAGASATLARSSLLAVIAELNASSERYGRRDADVHADLLGRGFRPYAYAPFERALRPLEGPSEGNNTLYLRDAARALERVRSAAPFEVLGWRI